MAKHHGAEHDFFAELVGFRLHHQHSGFSASHNQVQLAVHQLALTGVEHVLTIHIADAGRANRAIERDAGDRQRSASSDQGGDVGRNLWIQRQGVNDHLHFIEETFREQRANRAVNQAAGQGLEFARAAFTLEEAAWDLAGGISLLDVVDGQREEILPGLGAGTRHNGCEDHGVVDVDEHSAGGLARDLAGFHRDRVLAPLKGFGDFVEKAHGMLLGVRCGAGLGKPFAMSFPKPCCEVLWGWHAVTGCRSPADALKGKEPTASAAGSSRGAYLRRPSFLISST